MFNIFNYFLLDNTVQITVERTISSLGAQVDRTIDDFIRIFKELRVSFTGEAVLDVAIQVRLVMDEVKNLSKYTSAISAMDSFYGFIRSCGRSE